MKKAIFAVAALALVCSLIVCLFVFGADEKATLPALKRESFDLGELVSEDEGNTTVTPLTFSDENEMLASMTKACENGKYELYYSLDNMTVALKETKSGQVMFSNPYNAAKDTNHSGVIGQKLDSQIVISYLEKETKIVDLYSSTECAEKGQYRVKTYENALGFDLTFGETEEAGVLTRAFSKESYRELCKKISEDQKELLELYYTFYKASELKESNFFTLYPDAEKQDLYFCDMELSERDIRKVNTALEEAGYTREMAAAEAEKLGLGKSSESKPYCKLTVNYVLTDNGVTVHIPNKSVSYNPEFPLLRISVLPYFGADEASSDATGYLFVPDGCGTVIAMNREVENRRIIMTGKVYGKNASGLPKKTAEERVEQYYLPVFGTVRNNGTAIFGIITGGDANAEITSLLGRPNGNYYTVNPEFVVADYEQYTRVSVVQNAWSNKNMYLYDKNTAEDDFNIRYYFLSGGEANYSSMARVYREYLFGKEEQDLTRAVLNLETVGAALTKKNVLGFSYDAEAVFTTYEDNVEILTALKENNAGNVSLLLKGWQKNGLDTAVSDTIRVSSALGGKKGLKALADYCRKEKIALSLINELSFVGKDEPFDGFKPKNDAARTLELQYAKKASLSPDTMLYDEGKYVVKPSSYHRYLTGLIEKADRYGADCFNLGALGCYLNADYTKNESVNRSQALRYIKETLEKNSGKANLSFEKGNAYVLPYATAITDISTGNSGLPGETAAVPFLQMVLGGQVSCSSEPVNLADDTREVLLACVEGGTAPTFLLSAQNTAQLKSTAYTAYYSIDYEILKKTLLESYEYVNKVVTATQGGAVTRHEMLTDGVTVSTYRNGTRVYVNKSDRDYVTDDGITVKAKDYAIKE